MALSASQIAKLDNGGKYVVIMNAMLGIGVAVGPSIAAALIRAGDYGGILATFLLFLYVIQKSRNLTSK